MSTLRDRPRTALMVIDVQRDVVSAAHHRDQVVGRITGLVRRAREAGTPVVWVQHSDEGLVEGSEGWQYVEELAREQSEPLVHKHYGDSFEDTDLEQVLADLQVGALVVTGAESDACIRSTLHGGLVRGYDVTLVSDAHTTTDRPPPWDPIDAAQTIAFTNLYWAWTSAPGRTAAVVEAEEVTF